MLCDGSGKCIIVSAGKNLTLITIDKMKVGESMDYKGKNIKVSKLLKQRVSLAITLKGMRKEKK